MSARLVVAEELDEVELRAFLQAGFGATKAEFLVEHGAWWHRDPGNRVALVDGDRIIGYCGFIPTRCLVGGDVVDALWWMDLVILPEFRGRGLQRHFDDHARKRGSLKLGFPNRVAAKIHRRHGWGVREDFRSMLAPLRPLRMGRFARSRGWRRLPMRCLAVAAEVWARGFRRRLAIAAGDAAELVRVDAQELAQVFSDFHPESVTSTLRDERYLDWRYLCAPMGEELLFHRSRGGRIVTVTRLLSGQRRGEARLLDVFGDLSASAEVRDTIAVVLRDCLQRGATQLSAFAALPELGRLLRDAGFLVSRPGRFCWYSEDPVLQAGFGQRNEHWVIADSDNDEPT